MNGDVCSGPFQTSGDAGSAGRPPWDSFWIELTDHGSRIRLGGAVTEAELPRLVEAIHEAGELETVDLGAATYVDAATVRFLVDAMTDATRRGRVLRFVRAYGTVQRQFEHMGVEGALETPHDRGRRRDAPATR